MTDIRLDAFPPFDFHSVIHSHGWFELAPMQWNEKSGTLEYTMRLASGRVVHTSTRGTATGVVVSADKALSRSDRKDIASRISWMFELDVDFSDFYRMADDEPELAHVRSKAMGRLLRSPTVWEDVVKVMMTTNIQWSGTRRLVKNLVDRFGDPHGDSGHRAFPIPETIARSRESTLRGLGLGYRSPYILQLARGATSGKIDVESFSDPDRPSDVLRRDLLQLPGIGPYAAATLLGILCRYDFIGVDSEAMKLVSRRFFDGKPMKEKDVAVPFERWGKYKALAYWFWDWKGGQQTPMEAWNARQKTKDSD